MGYPIYHSAYTAAQIEASIGKGPRVNASGFWEVWNVSIGAYESTGVGAGVTPPTVVTQVSQMTNHGYIYIYNGTETGYTAGYWYYWDGSAWTAGGAYQVAATDKTLTVANAAADAKSTGDAVNELKSAIDDLQNITVEADGESTTETVSYTISTGMMLKDGSVGTGDPTYNYYRYTSKISVNPGDVITYEGSSSSMRVVTAFNGDTAVPASGKENVTSYTVPAGINSIVVSYYVGGILAIKRTYTTYTYHVKGMPDLEERVGDLEADQSELSNQVDDIKNLVISDEQLSKTENCSYTISTGMMQPNGSVNTGDTYDYYRYTSKISVNPGDVISFAFTGGGTARVITAFIGDTAVIASGATNVTGTYIVPDGINGIVVSYFVGGILEIRRTYTYTITTIKNQPGTTGLVYKFDVSSNMRVWNENLQDMNFYSIQFRGDIDTFNGLIIAHGYDMYMGGYVKVTPTKFEYYLGAESEPRLSENHNLTISDYIAIRIDADYAKAGFYVYTNGGMYSKLNQTWDVRRGALSVHSVGTNVLTNCVLSYNCKGWSKPIHLYGDSYFGLYDDKWTYYLHNASMGDYNLNGYPGRGSGEAYTSARLALNHSFPKKIIWCLGMNDGDNGAINTAWKTAVDALIATCEERGIELILATIPNVPTVDNSYKNAYVIASGLRYIDFAGAVGASSGTTWYTGMLSQDGVHPSAEGAVALFNQAIVDVPELMN